MPHHYEAKLALDPAGQTLTAEVTLTYRVHADTDNLEFILHRELKVDVIRADGLSNYSSVGATSFPYTPEGITWRLEFADTIAAGTERVISFRYGGDLKEPLCQPWGVNRLSPEWVELGMYGPWFPWNPQGGRFTCGLELFIDPSYAVAATGEVVKQGEGHWHISSEETLEDIVVTAAPNLKVLAAEAGRAKVRIYHVDGDDPAALQLLRDESMWVLNFYQRWFGDEEQELSLDLVVAPRVMGGGYARPGFIVLSDLSGYIESPNYRLFRFVAHELGHLWWTAAPVDTWEDWLNESFAEYSALVALREKYGKDAVNVLLTRRRRDFAGLPPIRGLDRAAEKAYETLYFKGSWLLMDLESTIGEEKMKELLRRRVRDKVLTTEGFLEHLADIAGENVARQFDQWLS